MEELKAAIVNRQDDTLKWIAIISMVIDHTGYAIFPEYSFLRVIGRIAFPIFAYLIAKGYRRTRHVNRYTLRLGAFALISQVPYYYFIQQGGALWSEPNIFFTLFVGLLAIRAIDHPNWLVKVLALPLIACADPFDLSYGLYGVLTIIMFYLCEERQVLMLIAFGGLNIYYVTMTHGSIQALSIFALPIIWANPKWHLRIHKYLAYGFYPVHLLIIGFLSRLLQ